MAVMYWRDRLAREPIWLLLAGGLIFVAILQWGYAGIDPDAYRYRDDGIITLSHARNWVDYGFIGVNPSGERLEASSSPLQLLLYAAAYGIAQVGYEAFMDVQTVACTFLLGALFISLFAARPVFALASTAAAAFALTEFPGFMIWHGSGMENAPNHVLLLACVVMLVRFAERGRVDLRWVVVPVLASIIRVESIYHVAPLLLVFCIYWHGAHRDAQARRFAAWFGGLWLVFNLARFAYFGSFMPNTAVAQGISIGDRLLELVTLSPTYLEQSFSLVRTNFGRHGGYLLVLVLPFLLLRNAPEGTALRMTLLGTLLLTASAAPFLFGAARLDPIRTTTQVSLLVIVSIATAAYRWQPRRADTYAIPLVLVAAFLMHEYLRGSPHAVCCSPREFDTFRQEFARIAKEQGLVRPTVSNPDLGVVSWHKQFNIVDLGLLGSSLVPRLEGKALSDYLLDHAAPDMLESHGYWTCKYAAVLTDPRFAERYVAAGDPSRQVHHCRGNVRVPVGIWVRRDILRDSGTAERALIDDLQRQPSVARVERELRSCEQVRTGPADCAYVARAAYRLLPEFRRAGQHRALAAAFQGSRSREISLFMLTGAENPRGWREALQKLQDAAGASGS